MTLAAAAVAAPFAYVTNQASDDKVWVVDTVTNGVVEMIAIDDIPSRVAITPDGAFAYVTIVVNEDELQKTGAVNYSSIASSPAFPGSAANLKSAAAAQFFSNKVEVIETASNTVVATITTDEVAPFGIAITPDGLFAYVTHLGPGVSVIDTASNELIETIPTQGEGLDVAITPDGAFAYLTTSSANVVTVIEIATNTVVETIEVGDTPSGIAITPDGAFAWVTNLGSNTVSKLQIAENTVVATLDVDEGPGGIALTPDGAFAYVTNQLSNTVSVIDTEADDVTASVAVGETPIDVAVTPDGAFAYVTNIFSDSVTVIDTVTNAAVETVPVGFLPEGIAITPEEQVVEVTLDIRPGNELNRINPTSNGAIWVAVLSTMKFDALQVDISSVRFGRGAAEAVRQGARDVDGDGLFDLLLRFSIRDAGFECGDTEAVLSGQTFDLLRFTGSDTVEMVGCNSSVSALSPQPDACTARAMSAYDVASTSVTPGKLFTTSCNGADGRDKRTMR